MVKDQNYIGATVISRTIGKVWPRSHLRRLFICFNYGCASL